MPSVGTSFVNNTLLFLLNTLVLTSENMLCKSSLCYAMQVLRLENSLKLEW